MNKAFAMILATLAFAAFAVDTNRVTMTRLGSLNPRSGEVVTDVTFEGLADATNVYTKAETEEKIVELAPVQPDALASKADVLHGEAPALVSDNYITNNVFANGAALWELWLPGFDKIRNWSSWRTLTDELNSIAQAATNHTDSATNGLLRTETDPTISAWAKAANKPTYTATEVGAIPTTGGVFNASLHLNQKLSVGTWTSSVKPYDISGGSGIAFVFGDNVHTKQSNTMTLGVGALNTNTWSFIWNGDADRMYIPGFPAMSNPYATRHNGGFHVNPSVRSGMTNPLQNFWIGDTNLAVWISTLAPPETDPTVPQWARASTKPTYTASEVGALSSAGGTLLGNLTVENTGEKSEISVEHGNEYIALRVKDNKATIETSDYTYEMPHGDGTVALTKNIPNVPAWALAAQKPTYTATEVGATSPAAVSNIVSTAYVRKTLGAWMEYDEATGFYYYCHEEE